MESHSHKLLPKWYGKQTRGNSKLPLTRRTNARFEYFRCTDFLLKTYSLRFIARATNSTREYRRTQYLQARKFLFHCSTENFDVERIIASVKKNRNSPPTGTAFFWITSGVWNIRKHGKQCCLTRLRHLDIPFPSTISAAPKTLIRISYILRLSMENIIRWHRRWGIHMYTQVSK